MKWADPMEIMKANKGHINGTMKIYQVSGGQTGLMAGQGITSEFLDYDLTEGEPNEESFTVFAPFRLADIPFQYSGKKRADDSGIETMHFYNTVNEDLSDAEIEEKQKDGEVPYSHLKNVIYTMGNPVMLGYPNYYHVDTEILTQANNSAREAADGSEVRLFQTRNGYSASATLHESPLRIDEDLLEKHQDVFVGTLNVEPASGITLSGSAVTMLSTYAWQCDPSSDVKCTLQLKAYDASNPLCYAETYDSVYHLPCSSNNVYTPKVHGGKILPLLWIRSQVSPSDDLADNLTTAMDTRYALSWLLILVPPLSFCIFLILWYNHKKSLAVNKDLLVSVK